MAIADLEQVLSLSDDPFLIAFAEDAIRELTGE